MTRRALFSISAVPLVTAVALLVTTKAGGADIVWPGASWSQATPAEMGMDEQLLFRARDYALQAGGSGFITRGGRLVLSWGDPKQKYDLKSTTKSIGMTAVALALQDGKLQLSDKAQRYHPQLGVPPESNRQTGWLDDITLLHLATQTAGFEKPGGYMKLQFAPGAKWSYSDGGPNWLAECITLLYRQDIEKLMFERVFRHLGITPDDLHWRQNAYRPAKIDGIERREFGSGVRANVNAMARIGYLYLREGHWKEQQLIPASFVRMARRNLPETAGLPVISPDKYPSASNHYGLLWWNNADGTLAGVPRDAYWSWGLYDSLIVVIPSFDIVVSRAGKSFQGDFAAHYDRLQPFLEPIVASARPSSTQSTSPYPPSPVITGIRWADASTIRRQAEGGDNWPATWADDGAIYTAYGDGWGFEPKVEKKLSLGFAKILGQPPDFRGVNIRSPGGEQIGQGPAGKKASGLLMLEGTLYMWARNAANSQLAWSADHGRTWIWSDWRFTTSFGHPAFLNFGQNYAGARDGYVYIYSHDHDSAYEPGDHMVMARVPNGRLRDREAYEFFEGFGRAGQPRWTKEIDRRGPVFSHSARCYRSQISYNPVLKRYLWCQIIPGEDTRLEGGFGVYDAPQPWGPWTTVFHTEKWDVGPGENCGFPTKWMSADGKTLWLVFSGDDYFSVRQATLSVAATP